MDILRASKSNGHWWVPRNPQTTWLPRISLKLSCLFYLNGGVRVLPPISLRTCSWEVIYLRSSYDDITHFHKAICGDVMQAVNEFPWESYYVPCVSMGMPLSHFLARLPMVMPATSLNSPEVLWERNPVVVRIIHGEAPLAVWSRPATKVPREHVES